MAILRRKDMAQAARIGDVVRSVAIGRRPEFVGSISAISNCFVNVRDSAGRDWHRSWGDLREVEASNCLISSMISVSPNRGDRNV